MNMKLTAANHSTVRSSTVKYMPVGGSTGQYAPRCRTAGQTKTACGPQAAKRRGTLRSSPQQTCDCGTRKEMADYKLASQNEATPCLAPLQYNTGDAGSAACVYRINPTLSKPQQGDQCVTKPRAYGTDSRHPAQTLQRHPAPPVQTSIPKTVLSRLPTTLPLQPQPRTPHPCRRLRLDLRFYLRAATCLRSPLKTSLGDTAVGTHMPPAPRTLASSSSTRTRTAT